jgi:uncharacterized protein (TIGR02118 family)
MWVINYRRDLESRQALEHWREHHAALVLNIPGVLRYVQNSTLEQFGRGFDGVSELWFKDRRAYEIAAASHEWTASAEDNAMFIDLDSIAGGVVEERLVGESAVGSDQR